MKFKKNFLIYFFSNILTSSIPFLLLPILTTILSNYDYGLMIIALSVISILNPISYLGIPALFEIDFFKSKEKTIDNAGRWFMIPLFYFFIIFILFFIFKNLISEILNFPNEKILLIPLIVFFGFLPHFTLTYLRINDLAIRFFIYEFIINLFQVILTLIFLFETNLSWESRLIAILLTSIFFNFISIFIFRNVFKLRLPKISDFRYVLSFSITVVSSTVFNQLIRQSDKFFILFFLNLYSVGIYAVGWQISNIMLIVISSVSLAWSPFLFKNLSTYQDSSKSVISKYIIIVIFILILAYIGINIFAYFFYKYFIPEKFSESLEYVPYLVAGYFFLGLNILFNDILYFYKKLKIILIISFFNLTIGFIFNYFFIKKYELIGASFAFLLTNFIIFLLTFCISQKFYPINWLSVFKRNKIT